MIQFDYTARICPGVHLAEDLLWMTMATLATTMHILPALDENENKVLRDSKFTSGAVM
jgi:hypothetical protein